MEKTRIITKTYHSKNPYVTVFAKSNGVLSILAQIEGVKGSRVEPIVLLQVGDFLKEVYNEIINDKEITSDDI